jgi:glycosyltransferase involved in cell wall biosynthesis
MVVLHYIASPFWGGGEQYIYDLSLTMKKIYDTHHVFICQPDTSEVLIKLWEQVGRVYCLCPRTKNGKFSLIEALRLVGIIQKEQVDIIHMHDMKDFFICTYAKIFCIRHVRLVATRHLIASAKNKVSWCWVYRHIDHMIFVSQHAADAFLQDHKVRQSFRNIHIILNSIYIPNTQNNHLDIRTQYNIAAELPLVLYHGRICKEKGIVQLLEALAPSFTGKYAIILAGEIDKEIQHRLERIIHQSPMTGYIYTIGFQRNITNIIAQCQVGILPSIVPEAASLSLLEHMAMGSTVIASNNGSQTEYARNGKDAILLPPKDWNIWQITLERLVNDTIFAQQLGQQAKKRFTRNFMYNTFIKKIYDIYLRK